jgi:hypothetical protein
VRQRGRVVEQAVEDLVIPRGGQVERVADRLLLGARVLPPLPLERQNLALPLVEDRLVGGRLVRDRLVSGWVDDRRWLGGGRLRPLLLGRDGQEVVGTGNLHGRCSPGDRKIA